MAKITPVEIVFLDQAAAHDETALYQESTGDDYIQLIGYCFLIIKNTTGGQVTQRIEVGARSVISACGTRGVTISPIDIVIPAGESKRIAILPVYADTSGNVVITGTGAGIEYLLYSVRPVY